MEGVVFIVLLVLAIPLIAGVWLVVRAVRSQDEIERLRLRVTLLEERVEREKAAATQVAAEVPRPAPAAPPPEVLSPSVFAPPPPPPMPFPALPRMSEPETRDEKPPEVVPPPPWPETPPALAPARATINWEQFMGVKGFAWVGGFALFLGIAFFVKYSFDRNLIPPELRVAIGFLAGIGLTIWGVALARKEVPALSQSLCATGVLVLYAVTFACRAFYHFPFFGPVPTFLLMSLITVAAFLLAVRLNALVVAILGMLGGFLTPILLSTGQDHPFGLFGYIAILDVGLILVALNRRWYFLPALAALGTIFMQVGWASEFFERERYFEGNKVFIALGVLAAFNAIYLAANAVAKRRGQSNWWLAGANLGLAAVAMAFTLFLFSFGTLAQRPALIFSYLFVIDLIVAALALIENRTAVAQMAAGFAVFGIMAIWTCGTLTAALLNPALVFVFGFAIFHAGLPALLQRRKTGALGQAARLSHFFPPLALVLVLVPIFKLPEISFVVWPFVLLVDLLAIVLAALSTALLPVLAALVLTLAAVTALIFKIPSDLTGLPTSFFLLAGFAVFFVAASVWLIRKFMPEALGGLKLSERMDQSQAVAALLPACSAVLPFSLLVMATLRLPLADPSPVFGVALLLVVLLLGLSTIFALDWMPLVALGSAFAVECTWHFDRFETGGAHLIAPSIPLAWYLVFYAVITTDHFIFLKKNAQKTTPWAAAALAGPAQFLLIYRLVKIAWPNPMMGLLPAAFALPALLGLVVILKFVAPENKARLTQLAWFGGVALFFITLIFPIQFERQWITIGWAMEGAALLWLARRVPHPGLRLTGFGLLVAAFARLALNPYVLDYHPRSMTPIFNWYLYTYGLVTAALYVGARLLAPPRRQIGRIDAQAVLGCLVPTLAFLLLNIEIADYFSAPGTATLTFDFSGSFARDMTYSIAWALFALGLLVFGIRYKMAAARYPALGLLGVTLLKLFLHDLAQLGQLYRIGAFISVAIVLMLASLAYHKFYSAAAKADEAKQNA